MLHDITYKPGSRYSDLIKRINKAREKKGEVNKSMAVEIVLDDFWRISRMSDVELIDIIRRFDKNSEEYTSDLMLSELMRRGLKA